MDAHDEQRRRLLRQLLAGSTLVAGGSMPTTAQAFRWRMPRTLPPGRSIFELRGTVRVDGAIADTMTRVGTASVVETGSSSHVIFRVGADAHLLRENARIELASDDGVVVEGLRLLSGALLSVFGERHNGPGYRLRTPVATIGIRGTGVFAEVGKDASYVCTCYGQVELAANDDASVREEINTTHHEAPRYILAAPENGKRIVPAPMKNHTDEELAVIEAIVGRKTPFEARRRDDASWERY